MVIFFSVSGIFQQYLVYQVQKIRLQVILLMNFVVTIVSESFCNVIRPIRLNNYHYKICCKDLWNNVWMYFLLSPTWFFRATIVSARSWNFLCAYPFTLQPMVCISMFKLFFRIILNIWCQELTQAQNINCLVDARECLDIFNILDGLYCLSCLL